jgi:hypothetical protein
MVPATGAGELISTGFATSDWRHDGDESRLRSHDEAGFDLAVTQHVSKKERE